MPSVWDDLKILSRQAKALAKEQRTLALHLPLLALAGFFLIAYGTRWGAGLTPDSFRYITAARNFVQGEGLFFIKANGQFVPITSWPPFYPILLGLCGNIPSTIGGVGIDPLFVARWLNAALFAALILLAGVLTHAQAKASRWTTLLAAGLILTSPDMLQVHTNALSEAPFLFFQFAGLFLLIRYLESNKRPLLYLSSSAIALAWITRFSGASLVAAGALSILLLSPKPLLKRLKDCLILSAIASAPILCWMARNVHIANTATNKEIVFHPIGLSHLLETLAVFSSWILPESIPETTRITLFLLLSGSLLALCLYFFVIQKETAPESAEKPGPNLALRVLLIFMISYILLLAATLSFFDAGIGMHWRTWAPLTLCVLVALPSLVQGLTLRLKPYRLAPIAAAAICLLLLASNLTRSTSMAYAFHKKGIGYASKSWAESQIVGEVSELASGVYIYSNRADALAFYSGRSTHRLPPLKKQGAGKINDQEQKELDQIREMSERRPVAIVIFKQASQRKLPTVESLDIGLKLRLKRKEDDGVLFQVGEKYFKTKTELTSQ